MFYTVVHENKRTVLVWVTLTQRYS